MMAMDRQKVKVDIGRKPQAVLYGPGARDEAIKTACRLRSQGIKTVLMAVPEKIGSGGVPGMGRRAGILPGDGCGSNM